ncbi:MAG: putative nucleic acid-binding Zn-ribbon protein [Flavobacteriales bacterium]|jgi:predicted  nucleic acid-binding Zn-ribbon protein
MSEDARKKLESMRNDIQDFKKDLEKIESEIPEEDGTLLGPTNDIEYQKLKKDIRESNDD